MDLIWTTGPRSVSLEAAYPFVSRGGPLRYHAAPNAHLTMTALNLAKRRHPIAVLPLLAVILNADVETEQSAIAWAFNALCNAASMHYAFGTVISAKDARFKRWAALDDAEQRAMLEALRTVNKTAVVDQMLAKTGGPMYLFRVDATPDQNRTSSLINSQNARWDREYPTLLRIAAAYGLESDDFEFYLTISLAKRPSKRVFFPFHVLSRPQAHTIEWNWHHVYRIAHRMLRTMRKQCNRHAEAAGLGDKTMDETKFVYWMVAHFSRQIQTLKAEYRTLVVRISGSASAIGLACPSRHGCRIRCALPSARSMTTALP